MIPLSWFEEARQRIAAHIHQTPLTYDADKALYLKWENHQVTGSFKARGALNKVLSLQPWELERGLVTASAGNHGQGVALAANLVGAKVTVFASQHAVAAKIQAMQELGADVRLIPGGYEEAEKAAIEYASSSGAIWVSPYNDGQVIAGQGSIALEILQEAPQTAHAIWVVPAGGGGLISGIAVVLKTLYNEKDAERPDRGRVIGVQSEASPFLYHLFHHGTQEGVTELPSLADGLAGPVQPNSLTIPLVRKYVDDFVLVSEKQIKSAIHYAWHHYQERIEGSGAAALAAAIFSQVPERPAVIILSGGNIQYELHLQIIANEPPSI